MSARAKYGIGGALYLIAGYFALSLMGAPMEAVNELIVTLVACFAISVGIFLVTLALAEWWVRRHV
jgi:hypothetical protein